MQPGLLLLTLATVLAPPGSAASIKPAPSQAQLSNCLVTTIDDKKVPAEVAGVLVSVQVKEGMQVKLGEKLAQINDNQAQFQRKVALSEQKASEEKADNDINVRFAQAAQQVAKQEYEMNLEAIAKVAGVKSKAEMQKLWLEVKKASLQIEQAMHEQKVAALETEGYAAKVSLSEDEINRRELKSPLAGEVVEVAFRAGEWVEPGNPVLRIVQMDRLRVEGFLNIADFTPSEVNGRPVMVTVALARGRVETFQGKIVFVNPLVQSGGEYPVWAEVDNRMENGQWVLRPGLLASMTIDVGSLAAQAVTRQ